MKSEMKRKSSSEVLHSRYTKSKDFTGKHLIIILKLFLIFLIK